MTEKDYTIQVLEEAPHPKFTNIKIKKIKLTNNAKNTSRELSHYHIVDWPDGRAPKQCQGLRFLLDKLIGDI